jgi:outer membrane protein OmpA-like peptidoglycan-associated protein
VNIQRPIVFIASTLALLVGCAHTAPNELVNARTVYERAANGPAKKYTPAELHVAKESLTDAERRFKHDGDTTLVRDGAYIAQRKTELAEALARIVMLKKGIAVADLAEDAITKEDAARTKSELAATKGSLADQEAANAATTKELAAEKARREDAEKRAALANADLARIASVKHEERGTVITLSGSVLFASNKFALLPAAMAKLSQIAEALLKGDPEATFVVEGHTDSQGKADANHELSVLRANAVRTELIAQGVSADRITSEGHGSEQSIADNKSAEGRANNRRVEIVVKPGKPR